MTGNTHRGVEDLLENDSFCAWVYHGSDDTLWQTWVKENPHRYNDVEVAKEILLAIHNKSTEHPDIVYYQRAKQIVHLVKSDESSDQIEGGKTNEDSRIISHFAWYKVAAIFVLIFGLGWVINVNISHIFSSHRDRIIQEEDPKNSSRFIKVTNETGNNKFLILPDGSTVLLGRNSVIRYDTAYGHQREVFLSGEAFFEVKKMDGLPFLVYSQEMVTRVLGTSFTVRGYDDDTQVSVTVKTGKVVVSVREDKEMRVSDTDASASETYLEANQQAVLFRENLTIAKSDSSASIMTGNEVLKPTLTFKKSKVSEVLNTLEDNYNISIQYDKSLIGNCTITAYLGDESLVEKLEMICQAIGAKVKLEDGQFLIVGEGCE